MNIDRFKDFYIAQLEDNFYPYWRKFRDEKFGGILNCIHNSSSELLSEDKFTWSQGRWLWILSKLYQLSQTEILNKIPANELRDWMQETYNFIVGYSINKDAICHFLLTRDGKPKVDEKTGRTDTSLYADCFALIGMSQYVLTLDLREEVSKVSALAESILRRYEADEFLTEPYPIPDGYVTHGIPMILINTFYEYLEMKEHFGMSLKNEIEYLKKWANFILYTMSNSHGLISEHKSKPENQEHRLLDRHINPGHTLEDAWFLIEALKKYGNLEENLPLIKQIVINTFRLGWDEVEGGLLRFVDREGGKPRGETIGEPYEQLVLETWDMKLWWPHSEMLYIFPLMYHLTKDEIFQRFYEKVFTYVMTVFPDFQNGEWIQIRRRNGSPEDKVVALPVKDPFHIMRNFIKNVFLANSV